MLTFMAQVDTNNTIYKTVNTFKMVLYKANLQVQFQKNI